MMYINEYYGVTAKIGEMIEYNGEKGIIYKDGGNYLSVNFDKDKPGECLNIHPKDPGLIYTQKKGEFRSMTRQQRTYQKFMALELGCSFAEYMGFKKGGER